jgi:hypothetical protein
MPKSTEGTIGLTNSARAMLIAFELGLVLGGNV